MLTSAVEFHEVSKVFHTGLLRRSQLTALAGVSFSVPQGSVTGLVGPNRAGKTTLVKILLSLCRPTSGSVRRLGATVEHRHTLARVGYIHEGQAFPHYLSATAVLDYFAALSLVPKRDRAQRIARLLDEMGLADRAHEPISVFSKGMAQRLALAQALVNDPELLVLDEPTEGLDLDARHLLHDVVRRRQRAGLTVLLVSHSLVDIQSLCDRIAVLRRGKLAFAGPLDELVGGAEQNDLDQLEQALEPLYAGAGA